MLTGERQYRRACLAHRCDLPPVFITDWCEASPSLVTVSETTGSSVPVAAGDPGADVSCFALLDTGSRWGTGRAPTVVAL
jgi:hypothetical protein